MTRPDLGDVSRGYEITQTNFHQLFDGSFQFCRVVFRQANDGDGGNWSVDFPRADENLSIRLSELTKTPVGMTAEGEPKHLLLRLTDPELYHCPLIAMTEPGGAYFDPATYSGSGSLIDWLMATLGAESQYRPGAGFAPSPMDANARYR